MMKIAKKTTRVPKLAAPIPNQSDVAFLLLFNIFAISKYSAWQYSTAIIVYLKKHFRVTYSINNLEVF